MKMQKRQFRIGQLAKHLEVERFVVRFWEKEFNVKSHRSEGGQRFYEEKDVATFKKIKKLLYEDGFTITGAKKLLKQKEQPIIGSQKTTLEQNEEPVTTTPLSQETPEHQDISFNTLFIKKLKAIRSKLETIQKELDTAPQKGTGQKELQ